MTNPTTPQPDAMREAVKICKDGREFVMELAMIMGVVDVTASEAETIKVSDLMPLMLQRAQEDRERWHNPPPPVSDDKLREVLAEELRAENNKDCEDEAAHIDASMANKYGGGGYTTRAAIRAMRRIATPTITSRDAVLEDAAKCADARYEFHHGSEHDLDIGAADAAQIIAKQIRALKFIQSTPTITGDFNAGARHGWMRCGVYHIDIHFEGRPEEQAEIDRRWPASTTPTITTGWQPIVKCPTDNSVHMMRLPDGTEFVGRWATSQQRWQRRSSPELVTDKYAGVGERVVWSNLPEGVYPAQFKPDQPPTITVSEEMVEALKPFSEAFNFMQRNDYLSGVDFLVRRHGGIIGHAGFGIFDLHTAYRVYTAALSRDGVTK